MTMKKTILSIVSVLLACLVVGCSDVQQMKKDRRYMTTPNISYVDEFPKTISLTNPTEYNSQLLGVRHFRIKGHYLIAGTGDKQNIFKVVDLDSDKVVGGMFNIGKSKEELAFPPFFGNGCSFYEKNDSLYADVFDNIRGRMLTVNVDESVKAHKLSLKAETPGLDNNVVVALKADGSRYLIRSVSDDQKKCNRSLRNLATGAQETLSVFDNLNEASLKGDADNNLLSCGFAVSDNGFVAEAPVNLNYINVYRLDGSFAKTVCIGKALDDIDELSRKDMGSRNYMFSDVRTFDNFFGVIHANQTWGDLMAGKECKPSVLLFSYSGEPIAEVKLDVAAACFDIDTRHGMLYVLDSMTGNLMRYDIKKALGFLPIAGE